MMRKYKAIIFDLDGTLLDTLDDLADSVNHILKKFDYPQRRKKTIRRFLGNGIQRLMKLSCPTNLTDSAGEKAFLAFKEYYTAHCQIKTRPYDEIMELLAELSAKGYKLAIVSNKNYAAVQALNKTYFSQYVQVAIGEKPGIRKKPAPDTALTALKLLNCTKDEAVYVGDSEVDKATADNTGLDCILVSWGFRDRSELQALNATYLVDTPKEILQMIEK